MLLYYISMAVLIPLVILFAGWMMKKHPPKKISSWYGYRTKRSMQSQAAWDFAHQVCGKIWILLGMSLLIGSVLSCISYLFIAKNNWYIVILVAEGIQVLLLLTTILFIERVLQKQETKTQLQRTSEVKSVIKIDVYHLEKYFAKSELIPAIAFDVDTKTVLMLAYMNEESLRKTLETGYTWYWSRSRKELWNKGATSGHLQKVVSIYSDCDDDTLLLNVKQTGAACHTGSYSCFFNEMYREDEEK